MTRRSTFAGFALALFAAGAAPVSALTLYDPGLGTLPSAQGWTFGGVGPFTQSVAGGTYLLDTAATNAISAGSAFLAPSLLDTVAGFTLDFGLRLASEAHADDNQRAGYSVIVTGADPRQAVEIGFRQGDIFVYTPGFVPGADASFATSASTAYSLVVAANRFELYGNGNRLLGGALVDYTASGFPAYTTPGAIFFGDDTSRARSSSALGTVTLGVAAVPEPQAFALMALGLAALGMRRLFRGGQPVAGKGRGRPRSSIAT